MKKLLLGLLIVMTLVVSFGCAKNETSGDASAEKEKVTITYFDGTDFTGAVQAMIDAFEEEYDWIEVDFQMFSGNTDDRKKTIINSLQAGDDELDVFYNDVVWISQFAAADWLMDLTDVVNETGSEYLKGPLSTCFYDGKAYALPGHSDAGLLLYRTDLIETPPKTWDELIAMSNEHIGKNGIEYGYVFQAKQSEAVVCNVLEFIKQNGGDDYVNGEIVIDSPETREAFQFMLDMIDQGIAPEGVLTHIPDDTRVIFEGGKALFQRNWPYAYNTAQKEGGDSKVVGKVGIAPLPVGPNGEDSSATLGGWNYSISKFTDEPEAAKLFVEFMTGEKAQKIRTIQNATFPTRSSLFEDPDVVAQIPFIGDMKPVLDSARPRPLVPDYPAMSTAMQVAMHTILTGQLNVDEGVTKLANDMEDILADM